MPTDAASPAPEELPTFDALPLSDEMRQALADLQYIHPTPVQREVFASAAAGKDLVVQARTGTGKTTAFGLPIVDRLVDRTKKAVQALVLCPTRELALQVTRELEALSRGTGIAVLPVYGGTPMPKQIEGLLAGAQILVGTPGRVLDHLRRGNLDPQTISVLTLDECDEMLSMGFLPQITEIWDQLPTKLQVLLFSATVPRAVVRVADSRLTTPEYVTLSGDSVGALEIEHFVYLSRGDKVRELISILEVETPESAIIFCNTRDDTQRVATALQRAGYAADWLNADLSQKDREAVLKATREERLPFLVCTDVAARGIDISHLTHVINFDFPDNTESYVHRTGRTGRAGRTGTAISLVSPGSIGNLYYLRLEYKIHPTERQLPTEAELKAKAQLETIGRLATRFDKASEAETSLARRLLTHDSAATIVAGLVREALAAEKEPAAAAGKAAAGKAAPGNSTPGNSTPRNSTPRKAAPGEAAPGNSTAAMPQRDRTPKVAAPVRSTAADQDFGTTHTEDGLTYYVTPADKPVSAALSAGETSERETDSEERDVNASEPTEEVFVNVGRDDNLEPEALQQALERSGIAKQDVAYIRVRQRHSFVGLRKGLVEQAIGGLTGQHVAGRDIAAEPARARAPRGSRRRDAAASN